LSYLMVEIAEKVLRKNCSLTEATAMRRQNSTKNSPIILWLVMGLMILLPYSVQSAIRPPVAITGNIGVPVVAASENANVWWNSAWDYRVPITVDANSYPRTDTPVEVALNFTSLFNSLGVSGVFDPASLRVVEVDEVGQVLDDSLAFQFDEAAAYDAGTNAAGLLIFWPEDSEIEEPPHTENALCDADSCDGTPIRFVDLALGIAQAVEVEAEHPVTLRHQGVGQLVVEPVRRDPRLDAGRQQDDGGVAAAIRRRVHDADEALAAAVGEGDGLSMGHAAASSHASVASNSRGALA
jgi:hypothetical protein